ncbi:NAD(P)H-binding protein [Ensifer aridi]|uniref:NAD(P)H-binding protein n=1 Tax=Ensifer aridi TaxID=1708715 RepID=UPI000A11B2C8|nr:NAD(P)H-binding protein [Ensifer aridi]
MIVITAPTSQIGRQLVEIIVGSGEPVRMIAREPSRLPARIREQVDVVQGSHGNREVVLRAFAGADALFWLVPPDPAAESLEAAYLDFSAPACEAIERCDVRHVVGVSALGRGTALAGRAGLVTASLAMDDMIADTGASYRALANPSFMDNLLRQAALIRDEGLFSLPLDGNRRHPTCATRDIAAAAAKLLLDRSWRGRADVPLLGPEDLSCNDMAAILTEVLRWPVRFQQVSLEAFKDGLAARGMSPAFALGYAEMFAAKDSGLDDAESRTPANSTPTSFREWCETVLKPTILG